MVFCVIAARTTSALLRNRPDTNKIIFTLLLFHPFWVSSVNDRPPSWTRGPVDPWTPGLMDSWTHGLIARPICHGYILRTCTFFFFFPALATFSRLAVYNLSHLWISCEVCHCQPLLLRAEQRIIDHEEPTAAASLIMPLARRKHRIHRIRITHRVLSPCGWTRKIPREENMPVDTYPIHVRQDPTAADRSPESCIKSGDGCVTAPDD